MGGKTNFRNLQPKPRRRKSTAPEKTFPHVPSRLFVTPAGYVHALTNVQCKVPSFQRWKIASSVFVRTHLIPCSRQSLAGRSMALYSRRLAARDVNNLTQSFSHLISNAGITLTSLVLPCHQSDRVTQIINSADSR
jgi:hypothetical protein